MIFDLGAKVLYIGQANDFGIQVKQSLARKIPVGIRVGSKLNKARPKISEMAKYVSLYRVDDKVVRSNLEALLNSCLYQ